MPTLHLQCSLDRLGPAYESGKPYFLLSLSAAFETAPTEGEVRLQLRPWTWKLAKLSVFKRKKSSGDWKPVAHRVLDPEPLAHASDLEAALAHELDLQLAKFVPADFVWAPEGTPMPPQTLSNGRQGRDWRSWLSHVGTYPGGIATSINLARIFVLDTAPANDEILLAAPHLTIDGTTFEPSDPETQSTALTELNGAPGVFRWEFGGGAARAYVNAPLTPVANPKTFVDIETLWRNDHAIAAATDWTARFDDRLASAFDLVERLLEWLRTQTATTTVPAGTEGRLFAAMFEVIRGAVDRTQKPPAGIALSGLPRLVEPLLPELPSQPDPPAGWADLVKQALQLAAGTSSPLVWPKEASEITTFRDEWTHIQSVFRTNAALTELVLETWRVLLAISADKWPALRDKLRDRLSASIDASLHHALLAHRAGDTWRALVPAGTSKPGAELDTASTNIEAGLSALGLKLWPAAPSTWDALLRDYAVRLVRTARSEPFDVTSDGLTVQVDRIENAQMTAADDQEDYLRRLAGVGVLLRKTGGDWRSLNVATLEVRRPDNTGKVKYAPIDDEPFVVPLRLAYGRELRQGFVTYVNQPLIARSPWADLTPSREMRPEDPAATETGFVRYVSTYKTGSPWQLERLVYGTTYDVAVFYLGNGGALPREIAKSDGTGGKLPWSFVLPGNAMLPGTQKHKYLRRCPVGPLRIEADEAGGWGPLPPPLPERVHPIASVVEPNPERPLPVVVLLPSKVDGWNTLAARQEFQFRLRPPALDVKVWDRWIEDDALGSTVNRDRRRKVLGDVHTRRFELDTGLRKESDASVDDPAISGFTVSFQQLWPAAAKSGPSPAFTFKTAVGGGIAGEQRPAAVVRVRSAAIAAPDVTIDANGCVVRVPDGEVWRVELTPVAAAKAADRFDPAVFARFAPTSFVVEVAAPLLPENMKPEEASAALRSAIRLDPFEDRLTLSVEGQKLAGPGPRVHRTDVLIQQWRWDGRPVYELPPAEPPESGVPFTRLGRIDTFAGDGLLFQSRENTDVSTTGSQIELAHAPASTCLLHELRWSDKAGLLYYRLGARLYSRYEGLEQTPASIDSTRPASAGAPLEWIRYAAPCRWPRIVPKPVVKLVVPLTEGFDSTDPLDRAPGWLVVLDEPWYLDSFGGLGETLESNLIETRLPSSGEVRHQFGPDPVIDMRDDPYQGWTPHLPRPLGAIGSTFDTDTQAPLFVRSAFFQRPPRLTPPEGSALAPPDLTFHFFKLRFRRVLAGFDEKQPRSRGPASEWTEGYWVQSLPPANWWRVRNAQGTRDERVSIDALAFAASDGKIRWEGAAATVLPSGPAPQPADSVSRFEIFALVTRPVRDAFGRRDQETFVALTRIDQLPALAIDRQQAKIRLVEVQLRLKSGETLPIKDGADALSSLASALFPSDTAPESPTDAPARIVRISRRLRVVA